MDFAQISYDVCRAFVRDHQALLGEEMSSKILGWIRGRDLRSLASCCESLCADPALLRSDVYGVLRQVESFFKKNDIYTDPIVARQNAISSFNRAERICRITNRRLDYYYRQRGRLDPDLSLWLHRAEVWISNVLGPFDRFFEDLPQRIRFTSGATASHSRRESAPHQKVKLKMECTYRAQPYVKALGRFFGYHSLRPGRTFANRVEFVPKNWKTERTIACEPEGNLPLQLAFDGYAKDRLRKYGVDLSDQSRNQAMAIRGSITGEIATIDLSMASDTLSINTVAWLLPEPWYRYLSNVRSPFGRLPDGRILKYAKFSSMGNGATFSLETLVFASACHAVGSKTFAVYGDDIAIETDLAPDLLRLLRFLGFIPNPQKTFTSGPFRESCGVDVHGGKNITPFYLRTWSSLKAQLSHNVNGLVSCSKPDGHVWKICRDLTRHFNLMLVPENEDSMSGVQVSAHYAYSKRLIRTNRRKTMYIPYFRAYKLRNSTRFVGDSRTLFLWYLDRYRIRPGGSDEMELIRSRAPTFSHKYMRKWVRWRIPPSAVGAADHLYWWSAYLDSASNEV